MQAIRSLACWLIYLSSVPHPIPRFVPVRFGFNQGTSGNNKTFRPDTLFFVSLTWFGSLHVAMQIQARSGIIFLCAIT